MMPVGYASAYQYQRGAPASSSSSSGPSSTTPSSSSHHHHQHLQNNNNNNNNNSDQALKRDDFDRQRRLARAARHSFTAQCRKLITNLCACSASSWISVMCVLFIMACTFAVAVGPFLWWGSMGLSWHPELGGFMGYTIPKAPKHALNVNRSAFQDDAATVVVAVRGSYPSQDFLASLMRVDPSENMEVIFVLGNPGASTTNLADRLVDARHKYFQVGRERARQQALQKRRRQKKSNNNNKKEQQQQQQHGGGEGVGGGSQAELIDAKIDDAIEFEEGAGVDVNSPNAGGAVGGGGGGGDSGADDDHIIKNSVGAGFRRPHPALSSPRMIVAKPSTVSDSKHGKLSVVPLGQLFADGADAARSESKYIIFLTSFTKILKPRTFVSELLRDIRSPAPCDNVIYEDVGNASDIIAVGRHANLHTSQSIVSSSAGGKKHLDKFGHVVPASSRRGGEFNLLRRRGGGGGGGSTIQQQQQQQQQRRGTRKKKSPPIYNSLGQLVDYHKVGDDDDGGEISNNMNENGGSDTMTCSYGAIQCLMLQPSTSADVQRSSSHIIADAGWTVDIGTASTDPRKFLDETVFLANREAGTPPNAARLRRGAPPFTVDAISPSCFIADRGTLYDASAFDDVREFPTNVDIAISGKRMPHVEKREQGLSALYDSIVAVENIMEHMSMEEVRRASPSLRRQVRTSYSAVMDLIILFEELSHHTMSVARAMPHKPGFPTISAEGSIDTEHRTPDPCMEKSSTEAKLQCCTDRLILVGKFAKSMGTFILPTVSEYLVGWLFSLHMRTDKFRVATSTTAQAMYSFAALLDPSVQKSVESKMLITSAMVSQVERLESWIPFLRSLHNSYRGFMVAKSSEGGIVIPQASGSAPRSFLRVVWFAICCGCCGFSSEIAHYVRPLSDRYPVSLIPGPNCFCPGYPAGFSDMIARQNIKLTQYVREELFPSESVIWISHTDPRSFVQGGFFVRRKPNYLIGRTMYEFSRIPIDWEPRVHDADELWVPSVFAQNVFLDAGLGVEADKVILIPEGVDTNFYSPEAHKPLRFTKDSYFNRSAVSWTHVFCNRDSFWAKEEDARRNSPFRNPPTADMARNHANRSWSRAASEEEFRRHNKFYQNRAKTPPKSFEYFSNFKWEARKGWEFLLEAFFKGFYQEQATEDVTLLILSYVYYPKGTPAHWDVFNETYIMEDIADIARRIMPHVKHVSELPRFCIVAESVTEFELAQLFRGADSFVLPTRGEGWGLPTLMAMSMGLPVISTNWGGSVDFTTPETSYLIELDGIEEVPTDSIYGWRAGKKWATPSVTHLEYLMRNVFENRELSTRVGMRAREHVVKNYDDYEVVKILDKRLQQISEMLE